MSIGKVNPQDIRSVQFRPSELVRNQKTPENIASATPPLPTLQRLLSEMKATLLLASCSVLLTVASPLAYIYDRRADAVTIEERDSVRITRADDTPWVQGDEPDSDHTNPTDWKARVKRDDADSVYITGGDSTDWTKRDDLDSVRITGDSTNDIPWVDRVKRDDTPWV